MNNELLLKSINELASALHTLGFHIPSHDDKNIVYGHLQKFQSIQAELRIDMQLNSSTMPQLNKTDCSTQLQFRKEKLIQVIDAAIDNHQTLGAEIIADAIIEAGL